MHFAAHLCMFVHKQSMMQDKSERLRNSLCSAFLACPVGPLRQMTHSDMYVCVFLTMANAFPSNKLMMWVRWSVYACK